MPHIGAIELDEEYVNEILRKAPLGLTHEQFRQRIQPDINQGWLDEAWEAMRRYFQ